MKLQTLPKEMWERCVVRTLPGCWEEYYRIMREEIKEEESKSEFSRRLREQN